MRLKGKVVIITGASSGIGQALAVVLAGRGAKLALAARRKDRLEETARAAQAAGARPDDVLTVEADVTRPEDVAALVKATADRFGAIDAIVNDAGVGHFGPIEHLQPSDLDGVLNTNIRGLLTMIREAVPHLKKTKGMVVNISSGLSKHALPYLAVYAGSKAMVDAIGDGLRLELKPYGIKVLTYGPPETETEFHRRALGGRAGAMTADGGPRRKMAKPQAIAEEIAAAMEKEKREVTHSRFLQVMSLFAPGLLDKMFSRMVQPRQ